MDGMPLNKEQFSFTTLRWRWEFLFSFDVSVLRLLAGETGVAVVITSVLSAIVTVGDDESARGEDFGGKSKTGRGFDTICERVVD